VIHSFNVIARNEATSLTIIHKVDFTNVIASFLAMTNRDVDLIIIPTRF